MTSLVSMSHMRLQYPGTLALDGAALEVEPGEVRALLGENGAGKSSLMKVLAGAETPESGDIVIAGTPVSFSGPRDARDAGVAMVFQEMSLAQNLSVAENITLGNYPSRMGIMDWKSVRSIAEQALADLHVSIPLKQRVGELTIAEQQMVEVAKAVVGDLKVLILDEPTSALTETETLELFALIRRLSDRGIAVLYISHNIEEIFAVCDSVTVMRDGRTIETHRVHDTTVDQLITQMVGRELSEMMPKEMAEAGEVLLEVRDLVVDGKETPVSFTVRRGEVVGFAGLLGAGRSSLMRSLVGDIGRTSGEIVMNGSPLDPALPKDAVRRGLGYLSDDRRASGIVAKLSIRENVGLGCLSLNAKYGLMRSMQEKRLAESMVSRLRIATTGVEKNVGELSGGNQQKVVLGKWIAAGVDVLILDEPTRGIDVGAKTEVYGLINELAAEGKAIILVSSYLPEVLGMSDRVMVMREGAIVGEYAREDVSSEAVMYDATGQHRPAVLTTVPDVADTLFNDNTPETSATRQAKERA